MGFSSQAVLSPEHTVPTHRGESWRYVWQWAKRQALLHQSAPQSVVSPVTLIRQWFARSLPQEALSFNVIYQGTSQIGLFLFFQQIFPLIIINY
jgi:hypothetical protein